MKDIKGYEGLYAITRDGKVWSHRRLIKVITKSGYIGYPFIGGKWLSLTKNKFDGYFRVSLNKGGIDKRIYVHRLVAENFIKNNKKDSRIFVNHKNGIKTDNRVENLEWCTASENVIHSFAIGHSVPLLGINNPRCKLKEEDIFKIFNIHKEGKLNHEEIGNIFNVCKSTISHILNKRNWRWLH